MARSQICFTAAPSGSGKSYIRGAVFVTEYLRETDGGHYSNFPLKVDEICNFVASQTNESPDEYRSRVKLIPQDVLTSWANESSGPWEFFKEFELDNWHIAIDEFHNFAGANHTADHRRRWMNWLGELRHRGATFEMISQHPDKIAKEVRNEAVVQYQLVKSDERRDPFLKIPMSDWYELRAGFLTGEYESAVWQVEQRRVMGRWKIEHSRKFRFEQRYFDLYDSFNAPVAGGHKGSGPKHEYLRRTRWDLAKWFLRRNVDTLWWRFLVACVVIWICFGGGYKVISTAFFDRLKTYGKSAVAATGAKPSGVSPKGQPTLADPVETAVALRKELNEMQEQNRVLGLRAEAAERIARNLGEKLQASYVLTLVGADHVVFANGETVRLGQKIEAGIYSGRTLAAVDWERRRAALDDGSTIALGVKPPVGLEELDLLPKLSQPGRLTAPGVSRVADYLPQPDDGLQRSEVPPTLGQADRAETARRVADLRERLRRAEATGDYSSGVAPRYPAGFDRGQQYAAPNIPTVGVQPDRR